MHYIDNRNKIIYSKLITYKIIAHIYMYMYIKEYINIYINIYVYVCMHWNGMNNKKYFLVKIFFSKI